MRIRFDQQVGTDMESRLQAAEADIPTRTWWQQHYHRCMSYSPYTDGTATAYSWFRDIVWAYQDLLAIYVSGDARATNHPDWILRANSDNVTPLYIPWGAQPYAQYVADIGNPAYRADWISSFQARCPDVLGYHCDDCNHEMASTAANASGTFVAIRNPRTGVAYTQAQWENDLATFMEEFRAAVGPTPEIVPNIVWWRAINSSTGTASGNPAVQRIMDVSDVVMVERGFHDLNMGVSQCEALIQYAVDARARGVGCWFWVQDITRGIQFAVGSYLLMWDGTSNRNTDYVGATGDPNMHSTYGDWSSLWETDIGTPSGAALNIGGGVWQRAFTAGSVEVNFNNFSATINTTPPVGQGYTRSFNGTTGNIHTGNGAFAGTGAFTLAALMQLTVGGVDQVVLAPWSAGGGAFALEIQADGAVVLVGAATHFNVTVPITLAPADGWAIVAVTKASGTVAPRFHRKLLSGGVWQHGDSWTTEADSATALTGFAIGSWDGTGLFANMLLALGGAADFAASDGQLEALTSLSSWEALFAADIWWSFDQPDVGTAVLDRSTGGAGDETGITNTSVSTSVPNFPGYAAAPPAAGYTRSFNGTTGNIVTTPGAFLGTGAFTMAALMRLTTVLNHAVLVPWSASGGVLAFEVLDDGRVVLAGAAEHFNATIPITLAPADDWAIVAVTKASGTVAPRFHRKLLSGGAWQHGDSWATEADNTFALTDIAIGSFNGLANWADMLLALAGVANFAASDGQLEALTSVSAWGTLFSPGAWWSFDQASVADPVLDRSANGTADQTAIVNTTVSTTVPSYEGYGVASEITTGAASVFGRAAIVSVPRLVRVRGAGMSATASVQATPASVSTFVQVVRSNQWFA